MTTNQPIGPSERVPAPSIPFEPAQLRPRHDGWTAEKQIHFIEALAAMRPPSPLLSANRHANTAFPVFPRVRVCVRAGARAR